jgi:hypothetical protein
MFLLAGVLQRSVRVTKLIRRRVLKLQVNYLIWKLNRKSSLSRRPRPRPSRPSSTMPEDFVEFGN